MLRTNGSSLTFFWSNKEAYHISDCILNVPTQHFSKLIRWSSKPSISDEVGRLVEDHACLSSLETVCPHDPLVPLLGPAQVCDFNFVAIVLVVDRLSTDRAGRIQYTDFIR
jgi:hypothetical protein